MRDIHDYGYNWWRDSRQYHKRYAVERTYSVFKGRFGEATMVLKWENQDHEVDGKLAVLNWGPWAGSRHGPGMVSAETTRKFAAKGVSLIEPGGGARACREEILHGPMDDVEIVIGEGSWERREVTQSSIRAAALAATAPPTPASPPLAAGDSRPIP